MASRQHATARTLRARLIVKRFVEGSRVACGRKAVKGDDRSCMPWLVALCIQNKRPIATRITSHRCTLRETVVLRVAIVLNERGVCSKAYRRMQSAPGTHVGASRAASGSRSALPGFCNNLTLFGRAFLSLSHLCSTPTAHPPSRHRLDAALAPLRCKITMAALGGGNDSFFLRKWLCTDAYRHVKQQDLTTLNHHSGTPSESVMNGSEFRPCGGRFPCVLLSSASRFCSFQSSASFCSRSVSWP